MPSALVPAGRGDSSRVGVLPLSCTCFVPSTGNIRRMKLQVPLALLFLLCVVAGPIAFDRTQQSEGAAHHPPNAMGEAHDAWAQGDYIAALNRLHRHPERAGRRGASRRAIALQTGELYRSSELTTDGRNPRFSPDGRFVAYETGLEVSRRTQVAAQRRHAGGGGRLARRLGGLLADGGNVAYLKIAETPELPAAAKAVDEAPLAGQNRGGLIQALNWQVLRNATIVVRDLDDAAGAGAAGARAAQDQPDVRRPTAGRCISSAAPRTTPRATTSTRSPRAARRRASAMPTASRARRQCIDGAVMLYVVSASEPVSAPAAARRGGGALAAVAAVARASSVRRRSG